MKKYRCKYLPTDLNLYLTSGCNFNCSFCRRSSKEINKVRDVIPSMVDKILEKFPIKSCCIAGFGEPFTSRHLFSVVERLNTHKIIPSIITNGSLVRQKFNGIKKSELLYVNVSLNAFNKDRHKEIIGMDCFDEVLSGIEMLCDYEKFPVMVSMVVLKNNYKEIPEFLKLVKSFKGAKAVLLNSLPYNEKAFGGIIKEKDSQIVKEIESYKKLPEASIVKTWPRYLKEPNKGTCNSPWASIGVDGEGNITGCRRVNGPNFKYGNIIDKDIWNSRYLLELRKSLKEKKGYYHYQCKRCFGNG